MNSHERREGMRRGQTDGVLLEDGGIGRRKRARYRVAFGRYFISHVLGVTETTKKQKNCEEKAGPLQGRIWSLFYIARPWRDRDNTKRQRFQICYGPGYNNEYAGMWNNVVTLSPCMGTLTHGHTSPFRCFLLKPAC